VPFAPGGTTDIVARIVAAGDGQRARPASGWWRTRLAAAARIGGPGDDQGHTRTATCSASHCLHHGCQPAINPKIGYDPAVDFVPIINIAATPNVIAVPPSFPARDYKGFIAELKKYPGKYSYASSGTGGIGHLQTETLQEPGRRLHDAHPVPRRRPGAQRHGGRAGAGHLRQHALGAAFIRDGRLIPIVVAAPQRLTQLPNVPTFKEVGLETGEPHGLLWRARPEGHLEDVVNKVSAACAQGARGRQRAQAHRGHGALIVGNTPEQFAAQMKAEFEVYKSVVAKQGLKLE